MTPEASRVCRFLAGLPTGSATLVQNDLQSLLLETGGNMLACGRLYDIISKHLGAGVYSITLKCKVWE